jgi:sigma-B regulation protein RsbU (phosphoserine phosphatase)
MTDPTPSALTGESPRKLPSLVRLITLSFAVPIVVACAALILLSSLTSRAVSEDLAHQVLSSSLDNVSTEVGRQLDEAMRVSDRYAHRVAAGNIASNDDPRYLNVFMDSIRATMLDDLLTTPAIASICLGSADDKANWLLRRGVDAEGRDLMQWGAAKGPGPTDAIEHPWPAPQLSSMLQEGREHQFIATQRPWYIQAARQPGPSWTPVYFWFGQQSGEAQTGIGYTRAFRNRDGDMTGALVIDVTLGGLSQFLRATDFAQRGEVYIVDDLGLLVAASNGRVVSENGDRLGLAKAGTPIATALATAHAADPSATQATLDVDGQRYRAAMRAISPAPGIDWHVVAVLPERTFLGDALANERNSIVVALLLTLGSVCIAVFLAHRLARPVEALAAHVARIGAGEFSSRLTLGGAREFAVLAAETNTMAHGLSHRLELEKALAVAEEVQQSLLPECDPTAPGLDIAGRTRYCDETGGDYFDFIDVTSRLSAHTLIAVGDVMGHGVASALLMASARAALRANAPEHLNLAELLKRVNRVLASDARHNRFMTLALIVIDPMNGMARWASAGHDPTIVFHPATNSFTELEGSGIPLGIMDDAEYQQYEAKGLAKGDVLVIGTDGIWESRNPAGEFFGKDRLRDLMCEHASKPSSEIAALIQSTLVAFRGREGSEDDVTFVVVKIAV